MSKRPDDALFLLELNEINFDFVRRYGAAGQLPTLSGLAARHGIGTTLSETEYAHVEPWIQWVTAHTGKRFSEHKVFRLGDIVKADLDQIWEVLERAGVRVGAMSPMNAANRLSAPAFFVPDPWTATKISADSPTRALYEAISQAVSDNATERLTLRSALMLLRGFLRHVPMSRWPLYAGLASRLAGRSWLRAVILDQLLSDAFVSLVKRTQPQFASLFLNAGAHIQHHYMFSSRAYSGERKNPDWYLRAGEDPILDIYTAYDEIVAMVLKAFPKARVIIATGLHQDPYPAVTFYWRLKDHRAFVRQAGMEFASVEPRMSRDFVLTFKDAQQAATAAKLLTQATVKHDGAKAFEVDNRGDTLFCTLVYEGDLKPGMTILINERELDLGAAVSFIAIKNGHHNSMGYLIDTAANKAEENIPLESLFDRVVEHFAVRAGG
jgi:hypothetical protein